jgi:ATP-binding cassette subfamily E protein 1
VYLIDEPSSHLDVEQRFAVSKLLKRFTVHNAKQVYVVEHDVMMVAALGAETHTHCIRFVREAADRARALAAVPFAHGFEQFLRQVDVTVRAETMEGRYARPRLNKPGSRKDGEQRRAGTHYAV